MVVYAVKREEITINKKLYVTHLPGKPLMSVSSLEEEIEHSRPCQRVPFELYQSTPFHSVRYVISPPFVYRH